MKKLISIDLDGTLLNNYAQLSKETIEYIKSIKDDHLIILNTGRPYVSCIGFYNQLNLNAPLVTDNGGTIWFSYEDAKSFGLDKDLIKQINKEFRGIFKTALFVNGKDVFAINYNQRLFDIFLLSMTKDQVNHLDVDAIDVDPVGFVTIIDYHKLPDLNKFIKDKLDSQVGVRFWGADSKNAIIELYAKDTSKFSAVEYLMNHFDIKIDDVICFGDSVNDLEMIKNAKHGVAMKNASFSIKDHASVITNHTNHDNGVVNHLKTVIKNKYI